MNESNQQMIEQLEKTAHELLTHIDELKSAHSAPELESAHEHLYNDAVAMQQQSRALEAHLEETARRVYQGG